MGARATASREGWNQGGSFCNAVGTTSATPRTVVPEFRVARGWSTAGIGQQPLNFPQTRVPAALCDYSVPIRLWTPGCVRVA